PYDTKDEAYTGKGCVDVEKAVSIEVTPEIKAEFSEDMEKVFIKKSENNLLEIKVNISCEEYSLSYARGINSATSFSAPPLLFIDWELLDNGEELVGNNYTLFAVDMDGSEPELYTFRLVVKSNEGNYEEEAYFTINVVDGDEIQNGWNDTSSLKKDISLFSPVITDLNNDGITEIIFGGIDSDSQKTIYIYDKNGIELSKCPLLSDSDLISIIVADIKDD
ncbi:MAG: hypothetical protein GY756_27755, partial [bacterium]|nr:hypothetical protein [bacterium]